MYGLRTAMKTGNLVELIKEVREAFNLGLVEGQKLAEDIMIAGGVAFRDIDGKYRSKWKKMYFVDSKVYVNPPIGFYTEVMVESH